jgi:hypothetical protein
MITLTTIKIVPDDLLDAARTIPLGDISTCDWLCHWVSATTFFEWAQRGLQEGDAYGLSNALYYAKRAACCRIDLLLQYNHLAPFFRTNYPAKIDALKQVGVLIPGIVHELVIDPRNESEHNYRNPDMEMARHAVDVAELFIRATEVERSRSSIVAVNWNAMASHALTAEREYVNFREFNHKPMLFIDVFAAPATAKIVDPDNGEVRCAELESFTRSQAIELAGLLRDNYSQGSLSASGRGPSYYQEVKKQAGF